MAIDDFIKGGLNASQPSVPTTAARSVTPQKEEPKEDVSTFKDVAMAIPRGVEGAVQSTYDLIDFLAMDALPDYDKRFLGRSQTTVGGFVENTAQFLTGFVPVAGALGKVGRIAQLSKKLDKPIATALARGKQLNPKQLRALSKQKDKVKKGAGLVARGAVADFVAFDAQEQRLSNLIEQYPTLKNPVTEFLAAKDDDGEIEGRLKNVVEGLFIEAGVGGSIQAATTFVKSTKLIKARQENLRKGMSVEEATEDAISKSEDFASDILNTPKQVFEEPDVGTPATKPVEEGTATPKPETEEPKPKLDDPKEMARVTIKEKFEKESLEMGGEQAVKSAVRNITSSEDVSELANIVAGTMLKEGEIPKTTFEELVTETKADMEMFGDRGEARVAAIEQLAKSGGDLTRVLTEQRAIKRIQGALGKELQTAATNLKDAKGRVGEDVARTEMYRLLDQFVEVQRIWGIYGRNLSLPFLQRKAMYKNGVSAPRDLGVGVKNADGNVDISNLTKEQITQFNDSIRGSVDEDKLVEAIARITSADDMDSVLKGLNKLADGTKGRIGFDMANEWYLNSLLSGITTQMVNVGGSLITNFMRNVEQSVGYVLNGDLKAAGAVVKYAYDMEAIRESFHLAAQAFRTEEGITFKHRRVYDDRPNTGAIRAERFGVDPESTLGQGMEWLFKNVVRLPSRGLTAGDEFFKSMNYRTFIKTQLHTDGMKKGIKGEDLDKYVQKSYQDYLVANRAAFSEEAVTREALKLAREKNLTFEDKDEFVETYIKENYYDKIADKEAGVDLELAKKGREWSLINTHTQDNGFMVDEINAVVRKIPALQLVIPFVRTPMNILQFAWERTAFGVAKDAVQGVTGKNQALRRMSQEMYSKLDRGSAQERAEIHGKMAMGVSLTGLGIYMMMFMEDDEQFSVTGFGARNKAQREAWMMAGNQPYSIRIGDKNYQYSRLDPIATTLGIFADLRDVMNNRYGEVDEEGVNKVLGALALTFANNLTNKSYVQGLDNLFSVMKEPLKSSERLAGNIAGGFFVPSFVNQMQNFEEDRLLRETRGLMDYVLKRSPSGSKELPPKRNFLGEAVSMENKGGIAGFLDPIYTKNVSFDALNNEIASMNHAFSLPQAKMGDIDLRQTKNAEGVEAYDRFLELSSTMQINGRTMRQALNGLIGSYEYNAMASQEQASENGVESPRIKEINRIVGAYRSLARSQMLQEFPELQAELMGKKVARRQAQDVNQ